MIDRVVQANERIKNYVRKTPCEFSHFFSRLCGAEVYLKLENYQKSGSFKIRGVMNKIISEMETPGDKFFVAASTGNHANAFATALDEFKLKGKVFVPNTISDVKFDALSNFSVEVEKTGEDCVDAENAARKFSEEKGGIYVSPYNDEDVVAGQGTIGLEILEQVPDTETVVVPVGGGGLISGIACYLKMKNPEMKIIGCQPRKSKVMSESVKAGKILDLISEPTISDATSGGIEEGSVTFNYCQKFVDDFYLFAEEEISEALYLLIKNENMIAEGGAVLPIAALIKNKDKFKNKKVVLVLSGKKINFSLLKTIVGG